MTIPDQSTEAFFARVNEDKIQDQKARIEAIESENASLKDLVDQALAKLDGLSKDEFRDMCIRAGYTPKDKA